MKSLMIAGMATLVMACAAQGQVYSVDDGAWGVGGTWSSGSVPVNGDAVSVLHTVSLGESTADLASLVVEGVLEVENYAVSPWVITADDITIAAGGVLTHAVNTDLSGERYSTEGWTVDGSLEIVCATLTVAAGGAIDVNAKGFLGGWNGNYYGSGPGGGFGAWDSVGEGGSHGGASGAKGSVPRASFVAYTYGDPADPQWPGSGGGMGWQNSNVGGNGGGLVRIHAVGAVTVNGTISANGGRGGVATGNQGNFGGGSGGGIFIECETIAGTGVIQADGERGRLEAETGAGGGRIAIVYDPVEQALAPRPALSISAAEGVSRFDNGDPGTLSFPDGAIYPPPSPLPVGAGRFVIPGVAAWELDAMTVTNGRVAFPSGFALVVTNDLAFTGTGGIEMEGGTLSVGGDVTFTDMAPLAKDNLTLPQSFLRTQTDIGGNLVVERASLAMGGDIGLDVGGNVSIDQSSRLAISDATVDGDVSVAGASTVTFANYGVAPFVLTARDVTVTGGGIITHAANTDTGGVDRARGNIDNWTVDGGVVIVCTNLTVGAGAAINANGKGYAGGSNLANPHGSGPGGGFGQPDNRGQGGSYGGKSGLWDYTYGDPLDPAWPGSGGGTGWPLSTGGGSGGGLIRLHVAEHVAVEGAITANGTAPNGTAYYGHTGGGSGGGILIECATISGSGAIRADAGRGSMGLNDSGAGGGRIAIHYDPALQGFLPRLGIFISAAEGMGAVGISYPGTIYFPDANAYPNDAVALGGGEWLIPDFTAWTAAGLTATNGRILFPSGFALTVTGDVLFSQTGAIEMTNGVLAVGGNMAFSDMAHRAASGVIMTSSTFYDGDEASYAIAGDVDITGGALSLIPRAPDEEPGTMPVTVGGDIRLDDATLAMGATNDIVVLLTVENNMRLVNGGLFTVISGTADAPRDYGALVDIHGSIILEGDGNWILPHSHPTVGSSPLFRVGKSVIIDEGSGFNATGRGYLGRLNVAGAGPGGGAASGDRGGGGGYGGKGGNGDAILGGNPYGIEERPMDPGSAGGGGWSNYTGFNGGGLIRIETPLMTLDGILAANGDANNQGSGHSGGGAGGEIRVPSGPFTLEVPRHLPGEIAYTASLAGGGTYKNVIWPMYLKDADGGRHVAFCSYMFNGGLNWDAGGYVADPGRDATPAQKAKLVAALDFVHALYGLENFGSIGHPSWNNPQYDPVTIECFSRALAQLLVWRILHEGEVVSVKADAPYAIFDERVEYILANCEAAYAARLAAGAPGAEVVAGVLFTKSANPYVGYGDHQPLVIPLFGGGGGPSFVNRPKEGGGKGRLGLLKMVADGGSPKMKIVEWLAGGGYGPPAVEGVLGGNRV
ncbi:MAG: hypothetical protein FWF84_01300, partial [Kiritimatiellaeota bacterium]|nr:hypothetical protein [Kiritimatiellota bacterium]